jgi:hypothetical protein
VSRRPSPTACCAVKWGLTFICHLFAIVLSFTLDCNKTVKSFDLDRGQFDGNAAPHMAAVSG